MISKTDRVLSNTLNIIARRNDSFFLTVGVVENNASFDFTGYTGKMQIKVRPEDNTRVILTIETGAGLTFSSNSVVLAKTGAQMDLDPGVYVYDCQVTDGTIVKTLFGGSFEVRNDVTR